MSTMTTNQPIVSQDMKSKAESQPQKPDFELLDLDPIKFKLIEPNHGEGWSHEKVEAVAIQYRRFLTLIRENPSAAIVPTEAIDEFWHYHILDTGKYAEDCNEYFGHFVHHFPYLGLRGDDDVKRLAEAFEITKNLYEQRFGESLLPTKELSSADCSAGCGSVVCSVGSCTDQRSQRPEYKPQKAAVCFDVPSCGAEQRPEYKPELAVA